MRNGCKLFLLLCLFCKLPASSAIAASKPRPLILVHGWGPPALVGFREYAGFLRDDGFPSDRIHILKYSFQKDLETIRRQLARQLKEVASRYPKEQKFDVIGHSTGDFVGLYAAASIGFLPHIQKYIGLSGIGHGWDCPACEWGFLGQAEKQLAPAYNAFVTEFYAENAEAIERLEKCSLFSPEDGLISPFDSGRFPDGINVSVPDMHHMDSVKKRSFYDLMKKTCYAGDLSP